MRLTTLVCDDDAVSPVLGVILMVAVAVILAAILAAFAFGFGDTGDQSPNPTFSTDYNSTSQNLTVEMTGGESFTAGRVTVTGTNIASSDRDKAWDELENPYSSPGPSSRVTAGDKAIVAVTNADWQIELVWEAESGDSSARLFEKSTSGV